MRLHPAIALLGLFAASRAWGLITIGDDPAILSAPANGAPWRYVAALGPGGGSAVYLGNGFLLTANHVSPFGPVYLDGALYQVDTSFGSGGVQQVGNLDLKVLKIVGDPNLPPLELTTPADMDLGQPSTLIGWGVGKGTVVPNQGWYWGDASTAVERWGSNDTDATLYQPQPADGDFPGDHLTTHFDLAAGGTEAQLAILDSGSGLFQLHDGIWKLAGIGVGADHADTVPAALYDMDSATPGNQPDASYCLRIESARSEILAIATVPEPALAASLMVGAGILVGWPRRARVRRSRN